MKQIKVYLLITVFLFLLIKLGTAMGDIRKDGKIKDEKTINKPKIVFKEQVYDFGKVYIGETIKCTFKFKNDGTSELIISNVKSSCGCTAALVSKNKLLKDEEGEVDVTYHPGNYTGRVTKSVIVSSNDTNNPRCILTITGEIIEEVIVNPKKINLGLIKKGSSCKRIIEIKTVPELDIKIQKLESPNSYITIIPGEMNDNNHTYQIILDKYDYIGRFAGMIFVYTTSKKQERIDVPFFGEVIGDVKFYPEILSFGNIRKGQDIKRTIIVNFLNKDVKIEKIEVNPNIINYVVSELQNSKKIDVELNKHIITGKINGNLRIYTNSTIQPVINIPIHGNVEG
ncbi:MAG: DUF1573 domain-containing protein [wastewater metagenome]|nr:DUF1573 domain-containing protein [Candidatus Loosdrechtia aerotolerans]